MVKIRFETGQVVNFEGTPTQADIDEVSKGFEPQTTLQKIGSSLQTGLKAGAEEAQTEVLGPVASGLSAAAFGAPRAAIRDPLRTVGLSKLAERFAPGVSQRLKEVGGRVEEAVFPEQRTVGGKALRGVAELGGLAKGGAAKLAGKVGGLVPKGAGRTAAQFGTFGATQLEKDPTLAGQAGKGAAFGALGGIGGALAPKAKSVFEKLKSDFVNTKLVPRVTKLFSDTLEKFPEPIQNFARNTAKVPSDIVKYISKRTPTNIRNQSEALKNNADNVFVGMDRKIAERGQQVTEAYGNSLKNVGNININKSVSKMESMLQKHGFIDKFGNATERVRDPLADPILKTIAGEFQALRGASGAGTTAAQRAGSTGEVNKFIWDNLKDRLSKLNARGGKLSPDITKVLDVLHADAERAGAIGIQNARGLARDFFSKQSLAKKFLDEKKIDKIFKLTGEESRGFRELDKYLGGGFEQQAKDLAASKSLKSLESLSKSEVFGQESKLVAKLKEAQTKAEFGRIKDEFKGLFGGDPEVESIFNELASFRRTQTAKKLIGGGLLVGGGLAAAGRSLLRQPVETVIETVTGQ